MELRPARPIRPIAIAARQPPGETATGTVPPRAAAPARRTRMAPAPGAIAKAAPAPPSQVNPELQTTLPGRAGNVAQPAGAVPAPPHLTRPQPHRLPRPQRRPRRVLPQELLHRSSNLRIDAQKGRGGPGESFLAALLHLLVGKGAGQQLRADPDSGRGVVP